MYLTQLSAYTNTVSASFPCHPAPTKSCPFCLWPTPVLPLPAFHYGNIDPQTCQAASTLAQIAHGLAIFQPVVLCCWKGAWEELIQRCEDVGVDAFEINFSCPHGMPERKMGMAMGQDCDLLGVRSRVSVGPRSGCAGR